MNRILVVHLKRFGDLVSASQTIAALKNTNPHAEISILCFKEFSGITKLIPGIKNVYTISRNTLLTLKNGKLYNNAFAINELESSLSPLLDQSWNKLINLTNNRTSAYICSWLAAHNKETKVVGTMIANDTAVRATNSWAVVFNDILPLTSNAPFNFRDVWAKMLGICDNSNTPLLTNSKNEENVKRHFHTMKEDGGRVVGIQLVCSVPGKGIAQDSLVEIVNQLHANDDHPVLLIAPCDEEREFATRLLENVERKPVVVECDFIALSSVVKHLDLLITPDTVTKHFADAHAIPTIEVSLGSSPTFKQATKNTKSFLVVANDRQTQQIDARDIIELVNFSTGKRDGFTPKSDIALYRPKEVNGVTTYVASAGNFDFFNEFDRHAISALISAVLDTKGSADSSWADIAFSNKASLTGFNNWSNTVKDSATNLMKDVLHSIRSLLQMKENPRRANDFIVSLDVLLAHCDYLNSVTVPVHFFRSRLESLPRASFSDNARAIETLLFNLKSDIQNYLNLINEWEKAWTERKFAGRREQHRGATL